MRKGPALGTERGVPLGQREDSSYPETPPSPGTPLVPPTVNLGGDAANRKSHPPRGRGPDSYFGICSQGKGHIWVLEVTHAWQA